MATGIWKNLKQSLCSLVAMGYLLNSFTLLYKLYALKFLL